jgi:hypothetical protein
MTMHPLQHLSMLITGLVLLGTRYDAFYEIDGVCPDDDKEGLAFVNGDKEKFMTYAMTAHASALVLHGLHSIFNYCDMKVFATFFLVGKIVVVFVLMISIQVGTDFEGCAKVVGTSQIFAWLMIELLLFYINLSSLSFFIFINIFKKYRSIRDREGYASNTRKTTDFLNYAREDIHWWSTWFNQFILCLCILIFRKSANPGQVDITMSTIVIFVKHFFGAYLIR